MIDTNNHVVLKNISDYILYDDINIEKRLFISWKEFESATEELCALMKDFQTRKSITFKNIYALPRGGLCLGVKLSYMTKIPLITDRDQITKDTLIVDDCTDTGKTLSKFKDNTTLVMYHKPTSMFRPDIVFKETGSQINFCWETKEERN